MRIYQAGPLFSAAEISWHKDFKRRLSDAGHDVQWPGDFFTPEEIESFGADAAKKIMERDRDAVDACEVVVALLDGAQVDDGTAWEVGYAYARGKRVVGIRTDFRNAGDTSQGQVNAMVEGSCVAIVKDIDGVLEVLRNLK